MKVNGLALGVCAMIFCAAWSRAAETSRPSSILQRDEYGFGLEFAKSIKLNDQADPHRSICIASFRWSAPASRWNRWGWVPDTDRLRLLVEPNIGWFHQANHGVLAGVNLMARGYLRNTGRFLPFVGGGGGVLLTNFSGLPSRINFTLLVGPGFDYVINDHLSFQAEYRLHHISNGDIRPPNIGIDSNYGSIGLSWWIAAAGREARR